MRLATCSSACLLVVLVACTSAATLPEFRTERPSDDAFSTEAFLNSTKESMRDTDKGMKVRDILPMMKLSNGTENPAENFILGKPEDEDSNLIHETFELTTEPVEDGVGFRVNNVKFNSFASRQSCTPTDLCRTIYSIIKRDLTFVGDVIDMIAILPPTVYYAVAPFLNTLLAQIGIPIEQQIVTDFSTILGAFMTCWQCNVQTVFGADPTAATVRIDGGVQGEIFFAQTLKKDGKPPVLGVVGTFSSLTPGQRYKMTVHKSGDLGSNCGYVGDEFSSLGGAFFTADKDGKAMLLMQDTSVLIDGAKSVLGRSVVVQPVDAKGEVITLADTQESPEEDINCGVVIRNVVPEEGYTY